MGTSPYHRVIFFGIEWKEKKLGLSRFQIFQMKPIVTSHIAAIAHAP